MEGKYLTSAQPGTTAFPKQYHWAGGTVVHIHTVHLFLSPLQTVYSTEVKEIHEFWKVCNLAMATSCAFLYLTYSRALTNIAGKKF